MERAMARICREAGASVSTNILLRDLNTHSSRTDERRIEVIANGLPLWNGSQLAIDIECRGTQNARALSFDPANGQMAHKKRYFWAMQMHANRFSS